jgi:hypothetical protein
LPRKPISFYARRVRAISPYRTQVSPILECALSNIEPPELAAPRKNPEEEVIIAALRASLCSPSALRLLARIELLLAEGSGGCARPELVDLIDMWAAEIVDVDRCEVERLKGRLGQIGDPP